MPTAPSVCVLGWVKYREHISLLVILYIIVYVTIFKNHYPIMVKCLNIGKNIDKSLVKILHLFSALQKKQSHIGLK